MAKKKLNRIPEMAYLDSEKLELLKKLSENTDIPRAALLRQAVDLLLEEHGLIKPKKRSKP
jgi:hypothetical protein